MKYFYIKVTTQYDGYEWMERAVTTAKNALTAQKKAEKFDFTHANGIELQEVFPVEEITEEEFVTVSRFLLVI